MTDTEKNAVNAAKLIREYCKTTGCMYCVFHKKVTRYEILTKTKYPGDRCVLEYLPREWPEEIKEEESN